MQATDSNLPNLFDFATTELSQDAFICWLVSWVNRPESKELHECAKDFICLFYNLEREPQNHIEPSDVGCLIIEPKRQFHKIDVFFQVKIKENELVSFGIEDKTDTTHHSNQLVKYKDKLNNVKEVKESDGLVLIYFKTGYFTLKDETASQDGYKLLNLKKIDSFLSKWQISNPIFSDYQSYIHRRHEKIESELKRFIDNNEYNLFSEYYVQYEFMRKLEAKCPEIRVESYPPREEEKIKTICSGKNSGGTPWTQYYFLHCWRPVIGTDDSEILFYRIDKRKNKETNKNEFYFAIRHYLNIDKKDHEARKKKIERFKEYRKIFDSLPKGNLSVTFSQYRTNDWSGHKESEVATLFFNKTENSLENVLDSIPRIHKKFLKRIDDEFNRDDDGLENTNSATRSRCNR